MKNIKENIRIIPSEKVFNKINGKVTFCTLHCINDCIYENVNSVGRSLDLITEEIIRKVLITKE